MPARRLLVARLPTCRHAGDTWHLTRLGLGFGFHLTPDTLTPDTLTHADTQALAEVVRDCSAWRRGARAALTRGDGVELKGMLGDGGVHWRRTSRGVPPQSGTTPQRRPALSL